MVAIDCNSRAANLVGIGGISGAVSIGLWEPLADDAASDLHFATGSSVRNVVANCLLVGVGIGSF